MRFRRSRLRIQDPHEISLVGRGANLKKFLVHKSEDEAAPAAADFLEAIIMKAQTKQGEDDPAQGVTKPKQRPSPGSTAGDDALPGKKNPTEGDESDDQKQSTTKVIKTADLDADSL